MYLCSKSCNVVASAR